MKPIVSIAALVLIQSSIALPWLGSFQVSGDDSNDITRGDDWIPPDLVEGILAGIAPDQEGTGVQGIDGQSDDDSNRGGNQEQDGFGNKMPIFPQADDSTTPQNGPGCTCPGSFQNGPGCPCPGSFQNGPGSNGRPGSGFPRPGSGFPQPGSDDSSAETDDDNEVDQGQDGPAAGVGKPGDDYPFKNCDQIDKYGVTTCQCTSFAAWRVDQRLNVPFKEIGQRGSQGRGWGNANQWDQVARQAGILVDNNPAPGSVAQHDRGPFGHVAWVVGVEGNSVRIEDYNGSGGTKRYGQATEPRSKYRYIHFEKYKRDRR
ncbi:N-acetylmuramoyl-L-alanine amidase sle1 [Beauveria bassiana D1-5]|uniref:N-acetylmuramoyl-L-alanine amidase sle1 n=1 Tax=Beauveria bassiana D1-5 TaxID=1245745 RepID=A0A0A2VAR7_BEABA|nr:N-acetylmuramoyl-L-alanine amidase sle1 [Beauveria bassiana D1-5]